MKDTGYGAWISRDQGGLKSSSSILVEAMLILGRRKKNV